MDLPDKGDAEPDGRPVRQRCWLSLTYWYTTTTTLTVCAVAQCLAPGHMLRDLIRCFKGSGCETPKRENPEPEVTRCCFVSSRPTGDGGCPTHVIALTTSSDWPLQRPIGFAVRSEMAFSYTNKTAKTPNSVHR